MTEYRKTSGALSKKWDVIVVGAGLSGLSAAKELRAQGVDVLVLEANHRVGGRTLTKTDKTNGNFYVDLGGAYIGPTQNSILNLIEELKLELFRVEREPDLDSMLVQTSGNGKTRLVTIESEIGNIFHHIDYVNMVKLIDSLGTQIPSEAPWLASEAEKWDSKTFKQFVDENCHTNRIRNYFNSHAISIQCASDPGELSMLWVLWFIKQCGGYGRCMSTDNGGQERKITNGSQQMSEKLHQLIGYERVLFNKPVCKVDQTSSAFVVVTTLDGGQFAAKYIVYAIAPHLYLKIHHHPSLPRCKNILAQRCPMGQALKVILYYKRPFWRDHGLNGCFSFSNSDNSRISVITTLDDTQPNGSHPAILGFVVAQGWHNMRQKSIEEIAIVIAEEYVVASKLIEFRNFLRVECFDWTQEQYVGGCYTSVFNTNTLTKFGPYLREPFDRIHFAGTETAIEWPGYMDGAVSAGKRAAREILHRLDLLNKDLIWQKEPDSRLVPPKPFVYPASYEYAPSWSRLKRLAHFLLASSILTFLAHRWLRL